MKAWLVSNRWLLTWLIAPMLFLAVAAFLVTLLSQGLIREIALNFAFLFLGVLITVLYVDWAVNRHEAEKWEPFQGAADYRLRRVTAEFVHSVAEAFEMNGPGPFQVAAWKSKNELNAWHLELISNQKWFEYVRSRAANEASRIGPDPKMVNHQKLLSSLEIFHAELEKALIMYGRVLTPFQLATSAKLIEEMPGEHWLIAVNGNGAPNFAPANLKSILLTGIELIEDVNRRSDPEDIELPWKEVVVESQEPDSSMS